MSAPLKATANDLRTIACAMDAMRDVAQTYGVRIDAYGGVDIRHEPTGAVYRVRWDSDAESYIIDDRIGD